MLLSAVPLFEDTGNFEARDGTLSASDEWRMQSSAIWAAPAIVSSEGET
jgi:hypothetical protein